VGAVRPQVAGGDDDCEHLHHHSPLCPPCTAPTRRRTAQQQTRRAGISHKHTRRCGGAALQQTASGHAREGSTATRTISHRAVVGLAIHATLAQTSPGAHRLGVDGPTQPSPRAPRCLAAAGPPRCGAAGGGCADGLPGEGNPSAALYPWSSRAAAGLRQRYSTVIMV
jgi:hypothetical protein